MNKIFIVIPTYNESKTIKGLIESIGKLGLDTIVIDDGSTDKTAEIVRRSGAFVITHKENLGKGISLKDGFFCALRLGCEAVITMDGDGQHNPQDIPKFLDTWRETKADLIIGNRMDEPKNMPFIRRVTNRFMSFILSIIVEQKIKDTQCGFRLISRRALEAMNLKSENYDIESEMIIASKKNNLKISSCKIESIYKGEASQISPILDTVRFIRLLLRSMHGDRRHF